MKGSLLDKLVHVACVMRTSPVSIQIWGRGGGRLSAAERREESHFLASVDLRVISLKNFLWLETVSYDRNRLG